jgi:hypothetical protein
MNEILIWIDGHEYAAPEPVVDKLTFLQRRNAELERIVVELRTRLESEAA